MGHSTHGKYSELYFSLASGSLLLIGFLLSFWSALPNSVSLVFYLGAYFFGGYYTSQEAYEGLVKGNFHIDFLMLLAAVGAALLGAWAEGALLLFLFSLGHALEHYALAKARNALSSLNELIPKTATLKEGDVNREVPIESLQKGDVILVRPNSRIPADGLVIQGSSQVNQAPITGESIPVDKFAIASSRKKGTDRWEEINEENRVFSGTINGSQTLEIEVTKTSKDSTLARMVALVQESQKQKSPTQRFTDRFERFFVPVVLVLVFGLNFVFVFSPETFQESFYRSMAVLVAASPCALAISTPSAVLSGVARAARTGILVKGGGPLEILGSVKAMAFDKTGTLTQGKAHLNEIIPLGKCNSSEILQMAMAAEAMSNHPLAKAIYKAGVEEFGEQNVIKADNLEDFVGLGVKATIDGDLVYLGNLNFFETLDQGKPSPDILQEMSLLEENGNTCLLLALKGDFLGILALSDSPRIEAKNTLDLLHLSGIEHMVMLSGDHQKVVDKIARQVGLDQAYGHLMPEDKVRHIQRLQKTYGRVAMVGDGVNDAAAMAHSAVGIAMGAAGNDVAMETADIALMGNRLDKLPFALALSRKTRTTIKQNLWISLGMVAVLVPLTLFDVAGIGPAVVMHEGSTLLVVANALRLLGFKNEVSD
ncbi:heavy metal translocating P-type ATPase [Pararhodonellum marinum]|uniref:heavy metal translocating P-type ATPase n=1 Tax=Pararhodonellum marinum TaxID=2755358 RepID=UPI00188F0674|nr:heavy metal translocating P-type ATPase [Pararhodonellum marinum]